MDAATFGALIERLEQSAARAPAAYRARVAGLAALGYVYILGMLLVLIAVTGLLLVNLRGMALKLAIPLIVVIGAVLQALWVRVPPPEGLRVTAADAPALFDLVRDVRARVRGPRVHSVLAVPELNAAIVQTPRLGVFGWYRNHLLIGLPLLQAVAPEEWQAILAHEMGHLSGSHGRFGAWIYRLRATWGRLGEQLERQHSAVGRFLFGSFADWYAPYFNAYTFVLARAHEYEADRASADVAGAETARRALLRVEVAGRQVAGFWSGLYVSAADAPEPPADVQSQLRVALRAAPPGAEAATWVSDAWRRPTDYSDTHPALAQRLTALGWGGDPSAVPPPPERFTGPSAAQAYLGAAETAIEEEFARRWALGVRQAWSERHAEVAGARRRLAELDASADAALPAESEWERIRLCHAIGHRDRATALADALLARAPDHTDVRFYLGQVLLQRGDARGLKEIEDVMRRAPQAILGGCRVLFEYHWARGETEAAERYRAMAGQRAQLEEEAETERLSLDGHAELAPHQCDATVVAAIREQLARYPEIREAYLARRVVKLLPEVPCYVLGIVPRRPWWRYRAAKQEIELQHRIAQEVTGPVAFYTFLLVDRLKGVRRTLQGIPGARVI